MQYYVIQVRTGSEDDFVLEACRMMAALEFLLPKRTLKLRKQGKVSLVESCVFPGYVFFHTEDFVPGDIAYYTLRRTRGFFRFLPDNANPLPLSHDDLRIVEHFASFAGEKTLSTVTFDENDRIVVLAGPLIGMEGRIVAVDRRKQRARIVLDLYARSFPIDLGYELVQKTESQAASGYSSDSMGTSHSPDRVDR
jgi:transcriptional antiterminator NusG